MTKNHYTSVLLLALLWLAACAGMTPEREDEQAAQSEHILLAEIARSRGEPELASDFYARALKPRASLALTREASTYALRVEAWPQALEMAQLWKARDPDNPAADWALGMAALQAGELAQARDAFRRWLIEASEADWRYLGGELQSLPRRWRAWQLMEPLSREHDSAPALLAGARMAMSLHRLEDAQRLSQRALVRDPDDPEAWWLKRRVRAQAGDAAAVTEAWLALADWRDAGAILEMATLLWESGDLPAAADLLRGALEDNPGLSAFDYALALVLSEQGQYEEALERFSRLAARGFRLRETWFRMAVVNERAGKREAALRLYDRVLSGDDHVEARARAIALLLELGREGEADERIELSRYQLGDYRHQFRVTLGSLLLARGWQSRGVALCEAAQAARAWDADAHYRCALGRLEAEPGSTVAVEWLRKAHRLWPEEPLVLNALGYSLADQDRDLREARRLIRQALRRSPDSGAILDSKGWVEYRLGNHQAAARWLEQAWERLQVAEVAAHKVAVKWALGQREEARSLYETARERWPDEEILEKTWQQLQKD
ncbi:tetratricopeptide repeat protein [Gammaproteobacteria bacterium AB-CW1]|uniref:Tetratricopeptide repeat protein n=1 Tax=Natronospira elongata TaxID=3110268 RepID=A0AAP6MM47_9GAMM|nr:tetratricopeptide repeat protein [Gammaproteobacteria bacterium AB-CW1]